MTPAQIQDAGHDEYVINTILAEVALLAARETAIKDVGLEDGICSAHQTPRADCHRCNPAIDAAREIERERCAKWIETRLERSRTTEAMSAHPENKVWHEGLRYACEEFKMFIEGNNEGTIAGVLQSRPTIISPKETPDGK